MTEVEITRIDVSARKVDKKTDFVAEEIPLHLFLNRTYYATIMCSPSNLSELAVGHTLTEGIIKFIEEIDETTLNDKEGVCRIKLKPEIDLERRLKLLKHLSRVILSACGSPSPVQFPTKIPKIKSAISVKASVVHEAVNRLNFAAETFRKTGGVHVAAVYAKDGRLLALAEDVGRHNAVDKAIGLTALKGADLSVCFLAMSGRLTGDIVLKAARVGVPIVASLAAAIDSGVILARKADLTLAGFVRGKRMNVYSRPDRILP